MEEVELNVEEVVEEVVEEDVAMCKWEAKQKEEVVI